MEQLIQKYIRYFYITFVSIILIQLLIVVFSMLTKGLRIDALVFASLSIVNIMLLIDSIKHNIKEQFTECKTDAKILRFTIGLLMGSHMLLYFKEDFNWVVLMDHVMIVITTVITLNYRIKTIEHLENMVRHFAKDDVPDQKGG